MFLHHPPFTNNPNTQSDLESLRNAFVSPFCRHGKALAMVAGHAHGYERYAKTCEGQAVQFIVSSGGGGPRPNSPPRFDDECLAQGSCEPSVRPLHYLLLRQKPLELEITVQALKTNHTDGVLEVVHLPYRTALKKLGTNTEWLFLTTQDHPAGRVVKNANVHETQIRQRCFHTLRR